MEEKIKVRFRFEKTGSAAFISHLDLMRTLGRALSRAEIPAAKTNGFNPHAYISIPCALSLGYEGTAEMADIGLPSDFSPDLIPERMNKVLPDGIRVSEAYVITRKAGEIAFADYDLIFDADEEKKQAMIAALEVKPLVVLKKSKRSEEEKDISPMILTLQETETGIRARLTCSAVENLNPRMLINALEKVAPDLVPAHVRIRRGKFYDAAGKEFK